MTVGAMAAAGGGAGVTAGAGTSTRPRDLDALSESSVTPRGDTVCDSSFCSATVRGCVVGIGDTAGEYWRVRLRGRRPLLMRRGDEAA